MKYYEDPVPYVVINNFFTQEDIAKLKNEVNFLHINSEDSLCLNYKGESVPSFIDKRKEIWLTSFLQESGIMDAFFEKINEDKFIKFMEGTDTLLGCINDTNQTRAIIAFYGDGDYIKGHADLALLTANLVFSYGDFEGGEFVITNKTTVGRLGGEVVEKTVPYSNGQLIIFPSKHIHHVNETKCKDGNMESKRISIQFFCQRTGGM